MYILKSPDIRSNAIREIMSLPMDGKTCVDIKEYKSKRSLAQNRMYWRWMTIISDFTGLTAEDMHRTFAIRLLDPEMFVVDGRQYVGAQSTTKLSTKEFGDYLDKIHAAAMQLNLTLPTPQDYGWE